MPTVKTVTTLGAGERVNIMADSQYRQPEFTARVRGLVVADPADVVQLQVATGSNILVEPCTIDELAATTPLGTLEKWLFEDLIQAGETIGVILTGSAAADRVRAEIHITPA